MIEMICKELGVEVGEEWLGSDGRTYKIDKYDGVLVGIDGTEMWPPVSGDCYRAILRGDIRPTWKPKEGEQYYVPEMHPDKDLRYDWFFWSGESEFSQWFLENNMIFKTKAEAIDCTNKMLEALKE